MPKNAIIFSCEKCDFVCCKKSNFDKYIATRKHLDTYDLNNNAEKTIYSCQCGKNYSHRQSLYNHKQICKFIMNEIVINEVIINKDN
jgi:hypothetical protein